MRYYAGFSQIGSHLWYKAACSTAACSTRLLTNIRIPYRTKVWQEKSLANLVNFTKSPNFIRQTSYNSTTIVSILTFSPNFIRQIDCFTFFAKLFSCQTFVLYGM